MPFSSYHMQLRRIKSGLRRSSSKRPCRRSSRYLNILICTIYILCVLNYRVVLLRFFSDIFFGTKPTFPENETCEQAMIGGLDVDKLENYTGPYMDEFPVDHGCEKFTGLYEHSILNTPEEKDFPLAYAISAYESFDKLSRLLRLIYRPQNYYCVHVDRKSTSVLMESVRLLVNCFGANVLLVGDEDRIDVQWGHYSVLQSTIICAYLLQKNSSYQWKYLLNVNEKEFPLRTNWELVRIMKAIKGSNMVEVQRSIPYRHRFPKRKLSFPVQWIKGSYLVALRYDFVDYILNNPHASEILRAMRDERYELKFPDELFFSTLAYNPRLGAPGACTRRRYERRSDPRSFFLVRYIHWGAAGCLSGVTVHNVCIMGVYNIPYLITIPHLFVNKFRDNVQPAAYDCMEYWIEKKLWREKSTRSLDPNFNQSVYSKLYCSNYHLK
ncbi:unnamed protein product [Calicophoron daubneyi]|uniref:Uncharacterized protein n=1 Tax=Calicophoron daubneyi TaxID=300641 RepID=A0AAV2TXG6_CALDB